MSAIVMTDRVDIAQVSRNVAELESRKAHSREKTHAAFTHTGTSKPWPSARSQLTRHFLRHICPRVPADERTQSKGLGMRDARSRSLAWHTFHQVVLAVRDTAVPRISPHLPLPFPKVRSQKGHQRRKVLRKVFP